MIIKNCLSYGDPNLFIDLPIDNPYCTIDAILKNVMN